MPRQPSRSSTSHNGGFEHKVQVVVGTGCLLLSAALVCLIFADVTATLPFRMPRSWYVARPLWYLLTAGLFGAAYTLLRQRQNVPEVWQPAERGRRFTSVRLYTGDDCPLCDEAKEVLAEYEAWIAPVEQIEITGHSTLEDRFGLSIPVVEIDGTVRYRGHIDEWQFRRLIDATPPQQQSNTGTGDSRQSA